jgi:predicted amidohydrolase
MASNEQALRVAAVQMNSGPEESDNLRTASELIEEAASGGAQLIVLPETFHYMGPEEERPRHAQPIPGPLTEHLASLAEKLSVSLVAGSMLERSPDPERCYNTSVIFAPAGSLVDCYRKVHLFDVNIPGGPRARESTCYLPGQEAVVVSVGGVAVGVAICFDLRFPEFFLCLRQGGAEVIVVPSAFTASTGADHWELLLRARALDSQCFLVAANQCGEHPGAGASFGHSLVVDPWGEVVARAGTDPAVLMADIDLRRVAEVRDALPIRGEERQGT